MVLATRQVDATVGVLEARIRPDVSTAKHCRADVHEIAVNLRFPSIVSVFQIGRVPRAGSVETESVPLPVPSPSVLNTAQNLRVGQEPLGATQRPRFGQ